MAVVQTHQHTKEDKIHLSTSSKWQWFSLHVCLECSMVGNTEHAEGSGGSAGQ